jgi:hypothetical protein
VSTRHQGSRSPQDLENGGRGSVVDDAIREDARAWTRSVPSGCARRLEELLEPQLSGHLVRAPENRRHQSDRASKVGGRGRIASTGCRARNPGRNHLAGTTRRRTAGMEPSGKNPGQRTAGNKTPGRGPGTAPGSRTRCRQTEIRTTAKKDGRCGLERGQSDRAPKTHTRPLTEQGRGVWRTSGIPIAVKFPAWIGRDPRDLHVLQDLIEQMAMVL